MRDYHNLDQKILNGIFVLLWLLSRPFVWVYLFLKWFVVSVTKEAGNRMVRIVGGIIAIGIVGAFAKFLSH